MSRPDEAARLVEAFEVESTEARRWPVVMIAIFVFAAVVCLILAIVFTGGIASDGISVGPVEVPESTARSPYRPAMASS